MVRRQRARGALPRRPDGRRCEETLGARPLAWPSVTSRLREGDHVDDVDFDDVFPFAARKISSAFWTPVSVAQRADAFYFFNPFEENLWGCHKHLDDTVRLSKERFFHDVKRTQQIALDPVPRFLGG
jgi:hypothetical protein